MIIGMGVFKAVALGAKAAFLDKTVMGLADRVRSFSFLFLHKIDKSYIAEQIFRIVYHGQRSKDS